MHTSTTTYTIGSGVPHFTCTAQLAVAMNGLVSSHLPLSLVGYRRAQSLARSCSHCACCSFPLRHNVSQFGGTSYHLYTDSSTNLFLLLQNSLVAIKMATRLQLFSLRPPQTNAAATRLRSRSVCHITSILMPRHWLTVKHTQG